MDKLENQTYYKYRSLEDFERFLDVIVNNRLYGAVYKSLNDPMEGKFNRDGLSKEDLDTIYKNLKVTRICSLLSKQNYQKFPDDYLMWSHYANSHTGCCIELKITNQYNSGWILKEVNYTDIMPNVKGDSKNKIYGILSVKTPLWNNEKEVRAVKIYNQKTFIDNSPYYHIKVQAVYLGYRINKEKALFYKKIINKINPKIKIYIIKEENISGGYFPKLKFDEI